MYARSIVVDPSVGERARASAPLLRGQRRLPLPGPGLRRSSLRAGRRARRGVAANRVRGGGVRALAPSLAGVREAGPLRPPTVDRLGRRARRDERLLLRGD